MANGVFTIQASPSYKDIRELCYHFPATYLRTVRQTVGDWVLYYEPRRERPGSTRASGRQSYVAIARVDRIQADPQLAGHYYAFVSQYLAFPSPVPFRDGDVYFESNLKKGDGSTNKGRFGRSVRLLPKAEYEQICRLGMAPLIADAEFSQAEIDEELAVAETQSEYAGPRATKLSRRAIRDAAFTRVVQAAYDRRCAMTGLQLINGGGRCEIEAAHIRPVEFDGPDSPRNGVALSRTVHWMFDRHWLSVADDGTILVAEKLVPDPVKRMLNTDRKILAPADRAVAPHPVFLRFHRERFKG